MGLITLITVDTEIRTQATEIITDIRRCGRRGITPVQHTTPGIMTTIMTTAMNTRSVVNLITTMVVVTVTVTVTNMTV